MVVGSKPLTPQALERYSLGVLDGGSWQRVDASVPPKHATALLFVGNFGVDSRCKAPTYKEPSGCAT